MFVKSFLICTLFITANSVHLGRHRGERIQYGQQNVQDDISSFGIKLNKMLVQFANEENIVFSPISVYITLALAHLGSSGNTRFEIGNVLGIPRDESYAHKMHDYLGGLLKKFHGSSTANVTIANGMFVQNDVLVKNSYLEQMLTYYDNQVINIDFSSSDAIAVINKWFNGKTNGQINEFFKQPLSQDTKLVFADTFYYDGQWDQAFPEGSTTQDKFQNADKQYVTVYMMHQSFNVPYYCDENYHYEAVAIPYQGGEYQFYVILPNEGQDLKSLVSLMDIDTFKELFSHAQPAQVDVKFPKFNIQVTQELTNVLKQMGVNQLFDKPDLSNMLENGQLHVARIQHAADADVNEHGSHISAGTSQEYKIYEKQVGSGDEYQFYVQRPFAYFLYHTYTNTVLFHGNTFYIKQQ